MILKRVEDKAAGQMDSLSFSLSLSLSIYLSIYLADCIAYEIPFRWNPSACRRDVSYKLNFIRKTLWNVRAETRSPLCFNRLHASR